MKRSQISLVLVAVLAMVLYAILEHEIYTWRGKTHPDFFIEWVGSRVALRGENPYSDETTISIQIGSKGHRIPAGDDQLAFVYPYYRVFLNAPIAFISYDWATAIWQTVMQAALIISALLFVRAIHWRPLRRDKALVIATIVLAYPTFGGLMLGQMAVGVFTLILFAYWALMRDHDYAAGGCLALSTVKPQLAIFALPFLLIWCMVQRRWRVLLAFGMSMAALIGASFLLFPQWLEEFVRVTLRYPSYKDVQTGPGYLLAGWCGGAGPWFLEAACIVWLLLGWWLGWQGPRHWLEGAFALSMAMTCFLVPQTSIVNQLVLFPAILVILRGLRSWRARVSGAALVVGGSWIAYVLLYETNYGLSMSVPPLVVLSALAVWYISRAQRNARSRTIPEIAQN